MKACKPLPPVQAPSQKVIRHQLLTRIREAGFPKDEDKFRLSELREAGLCKYKQHQISDSLFKLLVLFATQNGELRRERDSLLRDVEDLGNYHSPHWDKLRGEPDPLKRQKITNQAKSDEARVAQERDPKKAWLDLISRFPITDRPRPWRKRDERCTPDEPVFWHEPMTVMDYHEATGITRRTILNILHRLGAKPLATRACKNVPARYGTEINLAISCQWLLRYEKKSDNRRAWLVRTLLKYKHEAPEHLPGFIEAVTPVLESLSLHREGEMKQFRDYVRQCDLLLYPPPPPILGIDQLFGFAPESSVGKIV